MKSQKIAYRITSVLVALLIILPTIFTSMHLAVHHHQEDVHKHDITSFCGEEIKLCKFDNFTLNHFTIDESFHWENIVFDDNFKQITLLNDAIYNNGFVHFRQGRAPPLC